MSKSKSRKKAPTYASLKKRLDQVFSVWVRRRWADRHGYSTCVSCGATKPWKEMQAGHYVSRVFLGTRFDPENTHCQCYRCNIALKGNMANYSAWIMAKYGPNHIEELIKRSRQRVKYSRADLQTLIEEYQWWIAVLDGDGSDLF